MNSHTPEPWKAVSQEKGIRIVSVPGENIALCHTDPNGIRIVAAVNAVAGMTTEDLQALGVGGVTKLYAAHRDHRLS